MDEGDEEGGEVRTQIRAILGVRALGRGDYDYTNRAANVVGVRVGGAWQIYAQILEKQALNIRSVTRIWPA